MGAEQSVESWAWRIELPSRYELTPTNPGASTEPNNTRPRAVRFWRGPYREATIGSSLACDRLHLQLGGKLRRQQVSADSRLAQRRHRDRNLGSAQYAHEDQSQLCSVGSYVFWWRSSHKSASDSDAADSVSDAAALERFVPGPSGQQHRCPLCWPVELDKRGDHSERSNRRCLLGWFRVRASSWGEQLSTR